MQIEHDISRGQRAIQVPMKIYIISLFVFLLASASGWAQYGPCAASLGWIPEGSKAFVYPADKRLRDLSPNGGSITSSGALEFAFWVVQTTNQTAGRFMFDSSQTKTTGSLTMGGWVNVQEGATAFPMWLVGAYGISYGAVGTGAPANRFSMNVWDGTSWKVASHTSNATLNAWYHVVGVFDDDANELRLYINGTLSATTAVTGNPASSSYKLTCFGYDHSTPVNQIFGSLLGVFFLRRSATSGEIKQMFIDRYPQGATIGN